MVAAIEDPPRLSLLLPTQSRSSLPSDADEFLAELGRLIEGGEVKQGYVQAETSAGTVMLFILEGKVFCAGAVEEGRFGTLTLPRFFAAVEGAMVVTLCLTDLPLFLCTAVMFRKAPAAQIPSKLVDSTALIDQVRQMGKDAVLVIRAGEARSLVFCHSGEPTALYPAPNASFPEEGSVEDRIIEYIYTDTAHPEIVLELYDEIRIRPAPDAGGALDSYHQAAASLADESEPSLVVYLGDRVVFRYPITGRKLTIGRGGENDLPLDNLSVSREHAKATLKGKQLVVQDRGSENGIRVGGKKVDKATLSPGDRVEIGKYILEFRIYQPGEAELPATVPVRSSSSEETFAFDPDAEIAELEMDGVRKRVGGWLFTIGKKESTDLRIRGMFIAPIHVRISREPAGGYVLTHVAGMSSVKVNGKATKTHRLRDGDEITVGSARLRFHLHKG